MKRSRLILSTWVATFTLLCSTSCRPIFAPSGIKEAFSDFAYIGSCKANTDDPCTLLDTSESALEEKINKKIELGDLEEGYEYVFVPPTNIQGGMQTMIERKLANSGVIIRESYCCDYPFRGPAIFLIKIREKGTWGEITNMENSISTESPVGKDFRPVSIILRINRQLP